MSAQTEELKKPYRVDWAYPTSSWAVECGYTMSGCWIVTALVDGNINRPRVPASEGYVDKSNAQAFADHLTALNS